MILSVASFKYSSSASLICKNSGQRVLLINDLGARTTTGVALAPVAIGCKTVAATQRGEQAPAPLIGERELRFYRLFSSRRDSKSFPHPIDCRRRCVAFTDGRGAFEQRGNFA